MYSWISPKPYAQHNRFRVWCKTLAGEKTYETFATCDEAERFIESAQEKLLKGGHPIEKVIDQYLVTRACEVEASTLTTMGYRLRAIIRDRKRFPLEAFPWEKAWKQHVATQKPDSQHGIQSALKGFLAWTVEAGLLRRTPTLPKATGKKNRGKKKLHENEAAAFVSAAIGASDPLSVAAAACLLLGIRPGEATALKVRDLDRGGSLLWVAADGEGKTEASERRLEIAEDLQPHLLAQAEGKEAGAYLFEWAPTRQRATTNIVKSRRDALLRRVGALCRAAGIPEVVTQALRGTHATIAVDAAATSHAVMAALGHTSFSITKRHYLSAGTSERAAARRVSDRIAVTHTASRVTAGKNAA